MSFDFKKEYKEFYQPPQKPGLVQVPLMNYIAVRGKGDPNDPAGDYQAALGLLYGVAYTIKMSYKGPHKIEGYFSYVVPPLEGLWYQEGSGGMDYGRKGDFHWISMIRLPDFVTEADVQWAIGEAAAKKGGDFSRVEFFTYEEGLCVQCMHLGSYDDEPATLAAMEQYASEQGYALDRTGPRLHHEIYLSDPRKISPEKLKTVIREPVKKK